MKKFGFILPLMVVVLLAACNNNQNTVETDSAESENTEQALSDKEKAQQMREPKSTVKNTAGQQKPAAQRGNFRLEDNTGNIYSGEFAYMADAAYFVNCSTEKKYSVLMQEAFPELEKAYLKVMGENAGKRAYIVVEGALKSTPTGEEGKMGGALTVSKVHSVIGDKNCNSVMVKMGGMFASYEGVATFKECKSGGVYTVINDGTFESLEAAYKKEMEEGKNIYVELYGYRKAIVEEKGGSSKTGIVVTRFVGFDKSYSCE